MAEGNFKIFSVEYPEGAIEGERFGCGFDAINLGESDNYFAYMFFDRQYSKSWGESKDFIGRFAWFRMQNYDINLIFQCGHIENGIEVIDDERIYIIKLLNSKLEIPNLEIK